MLGQQVLQGVAGDLAGEPAELGADRRRGGRPTRASSRSCSAVRAPSSASRSPSAVSTSSADDVVDGAAVAEGPGAAGVVADHPADRAAGVRRRVGAEAQPVRGRGPLQGGVHGAGLRRARCGPPGRCDSTRLRCREVSTTMPVPTALPAIDVPAPRMVSGVPVSRATARSAASSSTCRGRTTTCGDDAVERGVGGVERPGQRGVVDVGRRPSPRRSAATRSPLTTARASRCRMPARSSSVGLARRGGEQPLLLERALDEVVDVGLGVPDRADAVGDVDVAHQVGEHLRAGSRAGRRGPRRAGREQLGRAHVPLRARPRR